MGPKIERKDPKGSRHQLRLEDRLGRRGKQEAATKV